VKPAVFFDLDGTLIDPRIGITTSICYALERLGRDVPDPDSLLWCIGPPLQGSLATLLQTEDGELERQALEFYRERYRATGVYECALYEGIPEALAKIHAAGAAIYLATSKPTVFAETILAHLGIAGFFDGVFGSELDGVRTDKSELLAHCLASLSCSAAGAVMVGDRKHDVVGAKANGMPCVGVLYGYGTKEELIDAGAIALVESPSELPGCCLALARKGSGPG
jgi:phosphoglycolate phosphatase